MPPKPSFLIFFPATDLPKSPPPTPRAPSSFFKNPLFFKGYICSFDSSPKPVFLHARLGEITNTFGDALCSCGSDSRAGPPQHRQMSWVFWGFFSQASLISSDGFLTRLFSPFALQNAAFPFVERDQRKRMKGRNTFLASAVIFG